MNHVYWLVQSSNNLVNERVVLAFEAGPVEVESVDVNPICRLALYFVPVGLQDFEFEVEFVDWRFVFARVSLQHSRQESLGVEESRHPETGDVRIFRPILHELYSLYQIFEPRAQRLQAGVGVLTPNLGQLIILQGCIHLVVLLTHHHDTLNGLLQQNQRRRDHL